VDRRNSRAEEGQRKWRVTAPKQLAADQNALGAMQSTLGSLTSDKLIEPNATDLKASVSTSRTSMSPSCVRTARPTAC